MLSGLLVLPSAEGAGSYKRYVDFISLTVAFCDFHLPVYQLAENGRHCVPV